MTVILDGKRSVIDARGRGEHDARDAGTPARPRGGPPHRPGRARPVRRRGLGRIRHGGGGPPGRGREGLAVPALEQQGGAADGRGDVAAGPGRGRGHRHAARRPSRTGHPDARHLRGRRQPRRAQARARGRRHPGGGRALRADAARAGPGGARHRAPRHRPRRARARHLGHPAAGHPHRRGHDARHGHAGRPPGRSGPQHRGLRGPAGQLPAPRRHPGLRVTRPGQGLYIPGRPGHMSRDSGTVRHHRRYVAVDVPVNVRPARWPTVAGLSWAAALIAAVLTLATAVLAAMGRDVSIFLAPQALGYACMGCVLLARRPGHPMGPLLCLIGLAIAFSQVPFAYARYTLVHSPGSLPFSTAMLWMNTWAYAPAISLVGLVLPMVFPEGRLLSPRWRPALWAALAFIPLYFAGYALIPQSMGTLFHN